MAGKQNNTSPHISRIESFIDSKDMVENPIEVIEQYREKLGPTFAFYFGGVKRTILSADPAFIKHVVSCGMMMMQKAGTEAKDYDYVVTHQPNGKFPIRAAKTLGFTKEQFETGLLTPRIGNTYSGAIFLGLAAILDIAKPGDRILAVAYGSGAGSDAFDITVTDEIAKMDRSETVEDLISRMKIVNYATYAKYRGKLNMGASK